MNRGKFVQIKSDGWIPKYKFVLSWRSRIKILLAKIHDAIAPEGYQDENGFHYGKPKS